MALNSLKHALLHENTIDLSRRAKVIILYALIQTNTPIKQYVKNKKSEFLIKQ